MNMRKAQLLEFIFVFCLLVGNVVATYPVIGGGGAGESLWEVVDSFLTPIGDVSNMSLGDGYLATSGGGRFGNVTVFNTYGNESASLGVHNAMALLDRTTEAYNSFNDTSSEFNLTFTGNENLTQIALKIPKGAVVKSATMDVTGFGEITSGYTTTGNIQESFNSPSSMPWGLGWNGTNLFSIDSTQARLYVHEGTSETIIEEFSLTGIGPQPRGLMWNGTHLVVVNANIDEFWVYEGVSNTLVERLDTPSTIPKGIAWNGTSLISCDSGSKNLYVHEGVSETILETIDLSGSNPYCQGIAWNGTDLFSVNYGDNKIYVHRGSSNAITETFATPSIGPTGLTWNGTNLISTDNQADRIYIYESEPNINYPTDVFIDISSDDDIEYYHAGELTSTETMDDFTSELKDYLIDCVPVNNYCDIPIKVHSDTAGTITLDSIEIVVDCSDCPDLFGLGEQFWIHTSKPITSLMGGEVGGSMYLQLTPQINETTRFIDGDAYLMLVGANGTDYNVMQLFSDFDNGLFTIQAQGGNLTIRPGEKLTIDKTTIIEGNVGIGTDTPNSALEVVGSIHSQENMSATNILVESCIVFASGGVICDSP